MAEFRSYTREAPSTQFHELIELYKAMHSGGYQSVTQDGAKDVAAGMAYPGDALTIWCELVRDEVRRYEAKTLLDYGSGKAIYFKEPQFIRQLDGKVVHAKLQDYWGVQAATYEPGLGDELPRGKFDFVVNADVLEHVFAADIPWVIDEMFSRARKLVFCNIACFNAAARLPTGEDAHIIVRSPDYWRGVFDAVAVDHPGVDYVIACSSAWGREHAKIFRRGAYEAMIGTGTYRVP